MTDLDIINIGLPFLYLCFLYPVIGFSPLSYFRSPQRGISPRSGHQPLIAATRDAATKESALSKLSKSGGILYRNAIFRNEELGIIERDVEQVRKNLVKENSSIAQLRTGATLATTCDAYHVFKEGSLTDFVRSVAGQDLELATNLPVEVRKYGLPGSCMAWHVDDVLYDPPQIEVVWTLDNTSDCNTMFERRGKTEVLETERNSVLLIQAGGPSHCVTSLKRGSRTIIKCAYVSKDAVFRSGLHINQFEEGKSSSQHRRKGKRRTETRRR